MRVFLASFLLLGGLHLTMAQDIERNVMGSAGESVSNTTAQLDITIGEVLTLTASSTSSAHTTQGFNQPIVASGNVSVSEVELAGLNLLAYPNPATDVLNIRADKAFTSSTSYSILNQLGIVVKTGTMNSYYNSIVISDLASSTYLIRITNENGTLNHTIRFTKN